MVKFSYIRERYGPFCVYMGQGKEGEISWPHYPIIRPTPRVEYPNAFAIVKGYIDCHGPEGYGVKRFEEGLADIELPGFEIPGRYIFKTGPEGVIFYCMSRCATNQRASRKIMNFEAGQEHELVESRIFALISGEIFSSAGKIYAPPLIVDASEEEKIIIAKTKVKGLELWV